MSVYLEIEWETDRIPEMEPMLSRAAQTAVEEEIGRTDAQACLLITGNEEIARLNGQFRNIPKATDVLSFPANQLEKPLAQAGDLSGMETEEGRIVLGDIAIDLDRAREQAKEYGHSLEREMAFLLVHGMLHLMGYDHIDPKDEEDMRQRQRRILNTLGLLRE